MAKQEIDPKDAKNIPAEAPPEKKGRPRVACPITKEQFHTKATPLDVSIGNQKFSAVPKEFSTGSMGYHLNPKIVIMVGDTPVQFQVGLNITAIGSKPKP